MLEHTPSTPHDPAIVLTTPFDNAQTADFALGAVGAGAMTLVVAGGIMFVVAGALKLVTWCLGGIASILAAVAPWMAVLLGIAAFSAYAK